MGKIKKRPVLSPDVKSSLMQKFKSEAGHLNMDAHIKVQRMVGICNEILEGESPLSLFSRLDQIIAMAIQVRVSMAVNEAKLQTAKDIEFNMNLPFP